MDWRPRRLREALMPEFGFPEAWLAWALRACLAGLAVFSLAVTPKYTTRPLLVTSAVLGLACSLGFAFVATRRPRTLKLVECAVLAAFAAHVMGHAFGFYDKWPYYDKLLHFVVPLVCALVLYALSSATDWIWQWTRVRPLEVAIYCFAMVLSLGALWEITEFGMDTFFHTQEQNGNTDTMLDLCADALGAILGAVGVAWMTHVGRERGFERVSEQPKSARPRVHYSRRDLRRG